MRELISIAAKGGLETLVMELAEESEKDAVHVAEHSGFIRVALLRNAIKDSHNKTQNMVLLELPIPRWHQWWNF
jgi:hypothetical protein